MNEQYTMEEWMGIMQEAGMDEGRLGRLAAGLGLGAAALAGGAKDADAQSAPPQAATVPNDSVQTGTSRDMGLAQRKAGHELDIRKISQQGARQTIRQNPDGTYSVTIDARKQPPATEKPKMDEQYTLEEWIDALQEVGVELGEGIAWPDAIDATGRPSSYVPGKPLSRAEAERLGMVMYPHDSPDDTPFDPEVHNPRLANKLPIPTSSPTTDTDDVDTEDLVGTDRLSVGKTRTRKITDPNWNKMAKRLRAAHPSPKLEEGIAGKFTNERFSLEEWVDLMEGANQILSEQESHMEEQYTLEEWMGMMEEAGYNINEVSPETAARVAAARRAQADQQYNKSVELTRQAGQHTEEPGTINATMRQTQRAAGDASRAADKLRDKAAAADAYRRKHSPDSRPAPAMAAADAPKLSAASKRSVGLTENTVARLQELAGIQPLNG
jgi:hypothetical protein